MRILHTSDWHLGRTLHGVDLGGAHAAFFDWLVELVRTEQVDAVVVAGDVYDRALPPLDAVALLEDGLRRLTELCPVIITPGNHDSAPRLGFGSAFFTDRLRILATPHGLQQPVTIRGDGDELLIYGMPYLDPDGVREALLPWGTPGEDGEPTLARSHAAVVGAAGRAVAEDLERRRREARRRIPAFVMAHAFAVGGEASDSERDITVGGVNSVPTGAFGNQIDYVALGHLHGPQEIHVTEGNPPVRYAGSPLAFSFSERRHHKAVTLVDVEDGRVTAIRQATTPVPRRLATIEDTMENILSRKYADNRDDWVQVIVRQDEFPDGYFAQVRAAFPHALQTRFESTRPRVPLTGPGRDARPPLDITADFVDAVAGREPTQLERDVLAAAVSAAAKEVQ